MSTARYEEFLAGKALAAPLSGFVARDGDLNPHLHPWQADIVRWALAKGKAALFEDCGLGKTLQQLAWADAARKHTGGDALIITPLAVAEQTIAEGARFGVPVARAWDAADVRPGITITNYERLHRFDTRRFAVVVADESSIIKHYDGKTARGIIEAFRATPFRLEATATPAPNDYMELGNHAEFLGIMTRAEMLATFFVHDGGDTSQWRLKGHARGPFWRWVCSWAVALRRPSDLGYPDDGYDLPPLQTHEHLVGSDYQPVGMLAGMAARTLLERRAARRASLPHRAARVAELVRSEPGEPWLLWVDLNAEADALRKLLPEAIEVRGSDPAEAKEAALRGFGDGTHRVLITKPSIAGWGLNWQHCARMAFCGVSDSFEQEYQAIRRCWRFGQTRPVACHLVSSAAEGAVTANVARKRADADAMAAAMVAELRGSGLGLLSQSVRERETYAAPRPLALPNWL